MENPETHPLLTAESVELYESSDEFQEENRLAAGEINAVKEGSIAEDSPQAFYIRSYNHFTDWANGEGLWGFLSSQEWSQDPLAQAGRVPIENFHYPADFLRPFYEAVLGEYGGKYPEGNQTWQKAVQERDFRSLGHVLHLIQDATVPAHVRNDPHAGLPGWIIDGSMDIGDQVIAELIAGSDLHDDSYELWVKSNPEAFSVLNPREVRRYDTLGQMLTELVNFTGSNFFSDNSTGAYPSPRIEDLVRRKEGGRTYYYGTVDGREVPLARKGLILNYILDDRVLEEQWKVLGTKAVEMGATAIQLYFESIGEERPDEPECTPRERLECIDGDVYRVDGCGRQELYQGCNDGQSCRDSRCIDDVMGECRNGEREEVRCGLNNNGTMERVCSNGSWGGYSSCADPDTCLIGDTQEFYSGPPGTAGVGLCEAGLNECRYQNGVAVYVTRRREITPANEVCGNGEDENCDGTDDECARFEDLGNGTVIDHNTRLVWQREGPQEYMNMSWVDAERYCQDTETAGHRNWRLPTEDELFEIMSWGGDACMEPLPFEDRCGDYWSSSSCDGNWPAGGRCAVADRRTYVRFQSGDMEPRCACPDHFPVNGASVRCVR